ncbi:MAG: serine/threonine protein kinase, partial [Alphaproteobacteria bacterium]|nr:serine/threonine protein kinase [Alphaproteobacteria bacterium]
MATSSTDPRLGQTFAERYKVDRFLGRGGMGVVYAAIRLDDQRPVALKLIHPELSQNTLVVERFRRELRLSAQLFSPYVVEVLDMGRSHDGELFMVMELLDGQPLSRLLARQGALRAGRVVRIGSQVAHGLAAAHELGIVHRDLKPDNIFVFDREARGGRPGERDRAKILDFGVARFLRTEQPVPVAGEDEWQTLTRQGSIVGTPRYMSPEAIVGDEATEAADLYSLGVVLYEMIAGSPPFACESRQKAIDEHLLSEVEPLRTRAPGCAPPALERIILKLLAKEPGDRPASAAEVAAQLVDALDLTEPDLFEELGAALTTSERSISKLVPSGATLIPEGSSGHTLIPEGSSGHTLIPEGSAGHTLIPEGSA